MSHHVDLTTLPAPVANAIEALVNASTGRLDALPREELGDLVQAAETVKGFADAVSLDATQALVEDVVADHGVPADDPRYAARLAAHRRQAGQAVVHEVQLLTGSTLPAARDRVRFATALTVRTRGARDRLRSGQCSWERARTAFLETAHLDPVLAEDIIDRLLAPADRTYGDARIPLSHNGFRARLRRQLALVESAVADADRRHVDAVSRRDTVVFPGRHGTATLQVDGDTARICGAQQRITSLARAARAAGDERTLAQLRADITTDLLVYGTVPGHEHLGTALAGKLHVIVNLETILPGSHSRDVAEIPGLAHLSPDQVRDLATRAGSTWTRLVTDPVTGAVVDAANTYRVPAELARLIKARDHTCRAPGDCAHPATGCDLDHDVPYAPGATMPTAGATNQQNLHVLHRGHHNTKTSRFWASTQHGDASITWATLTRHATTTPYDHHRPSDHAPPAPSRAERIIGTRLARIHENDLIPNVFKDLADHQLAATPINTCHTSAPPPPF